MRTVMLPRSRAEVPDFVRTQVRGKPFRYAMVSVVAVATSQSVLITAHGLLGWPGWLANVTAVTIGCIPSYTLNRYWVWNKRSKNKVFGEVMPFWIFSLIGLALSTVLVAIADNIWATTLAVSAANLSAFGALWVLKYLMLDAILFKVVEEHEAAAGADGVTVPTQQAS
jgi:putative flippase GtrA